ncbi:MAG: gliding motility protein GldL [Proteiniphilum sp.]|jgi:hypothetical protein|nr:gliding motility protein GldL [Proteiniphilum sp.]
MNAYSRYKNRLERFLQTERGKRFINFAYNFGAAIVILGAMCKLLHFAFGNEMLFIGMVTECIVFILSAFDAPVRDYRWEQVFPELSSPKDEVNTGIVRQSPARTGETVSAPGTFPFPANGIPQDLSSYTEEYGRQMDNLNRTLSGLNSIYEMQLKSVSGQIGAIEQISRGLSRLRSMYGDDLPDGSTIKAETERMAKQLRELNDVYARMLHAMTVDRHDNRNS